MKSFILRTSLSLLILLAAKCSGIQITGIAPANSELRNRLLDELRSAGAECQVELPMIACARDQQTERVLRDIRTVSRDAVQPHSDSSWSIADTGRIEETLQVLARAREHLRRERPREAKRILETIPGVEGSVFGESMAQAKTALEQNSAMLLAALRRIEADEAGADESVAEIITRAVEADPEAVRSPEIQSALSRIRAGVAAENLCTVSINESGGDVYASTGFADPPEFRVECSEPRAAIVTVQSSGSVRFPQNSDRANAIVMRQFSGRLPITGLSTMKEENRLSFSGSHIWGKSYATLSRLGFVVSQTVKLEPQEYVIENTPRHFSPAYAQFEHGMDESLRMEVISAGSMEVSALSNSQFTIGTSRGSAKYDLMFGHPNGRFADGIWSSFVSVRIDERVYRLSQGRITEFSRAGSGNSIVTRVLFETEQVEILQTLSAGTAGDTVVCELSAANKGPNARRIGFRILLDTWAGDNDGVPFLLPGLPGNESAVITTEVKFTSGASAIWETFDPGNPQTAFVKGMLQGPGLVPPNEAALVAWASAYSSAWEYEVSNQSRVTGDSAVLLWWKDLPLPSAGSVRVATALASYERREGISFALASPGAGNGSLYISLENASDQDLDVSYAVSMSPGTFVFSGTESLRYRVRPRERLHREIPMLLAGSGVAQLKVIESRGQVKREVVIPVPLPGGEYPSTPGVWTPGRSMPVLYTSSRGDLRLRARLRDFSGRVLAERAMDVSGGAGQFIYSTSFALEAAYEGRVFVEMFEP